VYVHAAVEGQENGKFMREEFVRNYYPIKIGGRTWRAIAWTTAGSICAVVDLVSRGVATHPATVYEFIYNLLVFGALVKLRGRFQPDGSLFLIYLSLNSVWRLSTDFMRAGTPFLFGLHQAQVIAIIVLAITIPLLALRTRWVKAGEGNESE